MMVRGEVFRLPSPSARRGDEQRGARPGVVVHADELDNTELRALDDALALILGL